MLGRCICGFVKSETGGAWLAGKEMNHCYPIDRVDKLLASVRRLEDSSSGVSHRLEYRKTWYGALLDRLIDLNQVMINSSIKGK